MSAQPSESLLGDEIVDSITMETPEAIEAEAALLRRVAAGESVESVFGDSHSAPPVEQTP